MNPNLVFAESVQDIDDRRKEYLEHRTLACAQAVVQSVRAGKIAYEAIIPPPPMPAPFAQLQEALNNGFADVGNRLTAMEARLVGIETRLSTIEIGQRQDRIIALNRHYRSAGTQISPWEIVPFNDGRLPTQDGLPALDSQAAANGLSPDDLRSYEEGYGLSHQGQYPIRRRRLVRFIGGELR